MRARRQHAMEANEMQPGAGDEGGEAFQECQRAHHEMGGAIAVRGFELEDHLAGWGAAQAFVAQGRARDVPTQPFAFLPLMRPTPGAGMQAEPLGTDTARWRWRLVTGQAQGRVCPCQHFLARPGAQRNAVGASRGLQRGQSWIGIGVGQIRHLGVFRHERAVTGERLE